MEPSNQKVAEGAPASFDCIAGIVFLKYFYKKFFYSNKNVSTTYLNVPNTNVTHTF